METAALTSYWIMLIPFVTALVALVVGVTLAKTSSQCGGPNLILWTTLGIFVLGPAITVLVLSISIQKARALYKVQHNEQGYA
jgi:ABC-type polysaccharide/polyol phosphate export permease